MKIVAISDTHEQHDQLILPDGDVLIHAGDITYRGALGALDAFATWFKKQPHKHKIVVAGNHDLCFESWNGSMHGATNKQDARRQQAIEIMEWSGAKYLQHERYEIDGVRFFGSPYTPQFFDWAFMLPRGERILEKWKQIPVDTDVLITHGPAYGFGDVNEASEHIGCEMLRRRIEEVRPKHHIFGHCHEGRGTYEYEGTKYHNVSSCNRLYLPVHAPVVIEV